MKRNKYRFYNTYCVGVKKVAIILFSILFFLGSCNEDKFLTEVPLDFLSPENSYVTFEDFEAALNYLHQEVRNNLWGQRGKYEMPRNSWYGTDLSLTYFDVEGSQDYEVLWGPQGETIEIWNTLYHLIYDANVIIGRSKSEFSQMEPGEQILVEAEARFFRGYAHAMLAHLWGGVPIVLEETGEPKKDYVRATRDETYIQSAEDLKFAADNLLGIMEAGEVRINKLAASHVLAEVYICLKRWDDAVTEASKVINDPNTDLMTERFGTRVNEDPHPDFPWVNGDNKDVYWDLFRQGNQDRSMGNTESIWVLQYSYLVPGGGDNMYELERFIGPYITRSYVVQSDGKQAAICYNASTYYMGRSQGFIKPSPYFFEDIWKKSGWGVDIRNAPHNIVRDIKVNNPNSDLHGKWVIADSLQVVKAKYTDTMRYYFPMVMKVSTPGKHPAELWDPDQTIPGTLLGTAEQTWRKHYMIRLAETYLLRAEAYLGKGDLTSAAADINVVRRRANAPDVLPAEVDLDYIMDEQLRELHFETLRIFTLGRMGQFVERVRKVNPIAGATIGDHQNLWAIPFSEIQKNTGATLEQNPGYN